MSKTIFNTHDYSSGDGMLTSVWGPPLWHVLHTMSFNYPVKPTTEQKQYYYEFFINLKNILPCKYCRDNYKSNLEKYPLTKKIMKNRDSLSRWVYELHEIINKKLGKISGLTYEDVRDRFEHFRSRCISENKNPTIEKGCTEPLYGVKSKCIINIVPKNNKSNSFIMDPKCVLKKGKKK
jgi:hypothetical protein